VEKRPLNGCSSSSSSSSFIFIVYICVTVILSSHQEGHLTSVNIIALLKAFL